MWLLYAANESEIAKLTAELTIDSEQAAKNLPTVNAMIDDIGKRVGSTAPAAAHQMLAHFKDVQLKALNSFVHGGIHSLRRHSDGFPSASDIADRSQLERPLHDDSHDARHPVRRRGHRQDHEPHPT